MNVITVSPSIQKTTCLKSVNKTSDICPFSASHYVTNAGVTSGANGVYLVEFTPIETGISYNLFYILTIWVR